MIPKIPPYQYTTLQKKIKEFDVLISDNDKEFGTHDNLQFKNLFRVYCRHEGFYATFLMSQEMFKDLPGCDDFIHMMLTRKFEKLKKETKATL